MLSPNQIKDRRLRLGGSDMSIVVGQDAPKIFRLWQEKRGEIEPENLDHVWPVQLGIQTEPLNLRWFELQNSTVLTRQGHVCWHSWYRWAAVTLDGWIEELGCPIECKHCGGWEPMEVLIDRYQPQMQYQMECTRARQCALSVIMGANEPVVTFIDRDPVYISKMMALGAQFWKHVEDHTPPVDLVTALEPPTYDKMRTVSMVGNNQWGSEAFTWLETKADAQRFEQSTKALKAMVEPDVRKAAGHGVQIVRSKPDAQGRTKLYVREET